MPSLVLGIALAIFASSAHVAGIEARALALEKKLVAPCCWQGTLEVHHSELADSLHAEIRARLGRRESATSIEELLIGRFGARVVAVPSPGLLEGTAVAVMLALLLAGSGLWMLARLWSRRVRESALTGAPEAEASQTAYDAQIDAELERLR